MTLTMTGFGHAAVFQRTWRGCCRAAVPSPEGGFSRRRARRNRPRTGYPGQPITKIFGSRTLSSGLQQRCSRRQATTHMDRLTSNDAHLHGPPPSSLARVLLQDDDAGVIQQRRRHGARLRRDGSRMRARLAWGRRKFRRFIISTRWKAAGDGKPKDGDLAIGCSSSWRNRNISTPRSNPSQLRTRLTSRILATAKKRPRSGGTAEQERLQVLEQVRGFLRASLPPDGTRLACGTRTGRRLFGPATGRELVTMEGRTWTLE